MEQKILEAINSLKSEFIEFKNEVNIKLDIMENAILDNTSKIDRNYKSIKSMCRVVEAELSDKAA